MEHSHHHDYVNPLAWILAVTGWAYHYLASTPNFAMVLTVPGAAAIVDASAKLLLGGGTFLTAVVSFRKYNERIKDQAAEIVKLNVEIATLKDAASKAETKAEKVGDDLSRKREKDHDNADRLNDTLLAMQLKIKELEDAAAHGVRDGGR